MSNRIELDRCATGMDWLGDLLGVCCAKDKVDVWRSVLQEFEDGALCITCEFMAIVDWDSLNKVRRM